MIPSDLQQKGWSRVSLCHPQERASTAPLPHRTKGNASPDPKPTKTHGLAHPFPKFTPERFPLSSKENVMPKSCKSSQGSDLGKREVMKFLMSCWAFSPTANTELSCHAENEQVRCFSLPCPGEIVQPSTSPCPCQGYRRGWSQHPPPGWKPARNTKAFPPSSPSVQSINASDGAEE